MKNTCPKCDTAYNVNASVVGRKFTCKNCGTPVVVTTEGLDYQNPPAKGPPAAAPAATGGAFDFDASGGGEEEERRPAKGSKPAKPTKSRSRDDDDEEDSRPTRKKKKVEEDTEDDDLDSLPQRKPKKGSDKSLVKDFLFFREFIAPIFVKLIFVLTLIGVVLGGFVVVIGGLYMGSIWTILGALMFLVLGVPFAMLATRIYCELILLGFAIHDRLGEVKALLEKSNTPPPPPAPPATTP